MKVGDKVRIRTGRRGNPPRGEVVEIQPNGMVSVRVRSGAVQGFRTDELKVVNATEVA